MPFIVRAKNEIEAVLKVINIIKTEGIRSSRYNEVLNCLLSIRYSEKQFDKFTAHRSSFIGAVGKTAAAAFKRADRIYNDGSDLMTKPNYWKRMRAFNEMLDQTQISIDQIDNIISEIAQSPKNSTLTFSIFRPVDILKKKRQGYVPCPVAGDFKFRNGELQLNVFFRSNDALNFLYPDLYHLRRLQLFTLDEAKKITIHPSLKAGKVGKLNIYFSRIYLPVRMEMSKRDYVNTKEIKKRTARLVNTLSDLKEK